MTAAPIKAGIVTEKVAFVRRMVDAIRRLPLSGYDDFAADPRNAAAGESYLRRALESLFDLGRHILAKGFAKAPAEYKEIAAALVSEGIITDEDCRKMREMAGYRNRMVHFYDEISQDELYRILRDDLSDIERACDVLVEWLHEHPDKVDSSI
jgi:uncharacterized protein YutE (UPF0331/DUF86 family)